MQFPQVNLRGDLHGRVHAEDADADIDRVDVRIREPLRDGTTTVARFVGVHLPVHVRISEDATDLRQILRISLPAGVPGPIRVMRSFCSALSIWDSAPVHGTARRTYSVAILHARNRGFRPCLRRQRPIAPSAQREIGCLLFPNSALVARRPATGLDARDEVGHRFVEQRRLFLVHHVAGLGKHHQA